MRILQVIHDFLPEHTAGSELYTYYLSKELAKRHSVYLMFTEVDHQRPQYDYRRSSYFGIPYYEVIHNHIYRRFEDTYADPLMERVFSSILDEVHPDIIHLQHLLNHSINYISIAKKRGIPVVFTLHDYWLTCPNGGQRIRPDLHVCEEIELEHCSECIRRFSGHSYLASRFASSLLGLRAGANGSSLLDRFSGARIETPKPEYVRRGQFVLGGVPRPVLIAHPPARVAFDLNVPAGTRLRFGIGMAPGTFDKPGGGVAFEIRTGGKMIWSHTIDPKTRPEDQRWIDDEVTLPAAENGTLHLDLVTQPTAEGDNQHCTAGWSGLALQKAPDMSQARIARAKVLYRAIEGFFSTDTEARRMAKVARRVERVREACRHVDLFLAPSSFLAKRLEEFGLPADRVVISDLGMRADLLQPFRRRPSDVLRFGYIGTLVRHKGVHVLMDAFNRLRSRRKDRNAALKIYGNLDWFPDYSSHLRSLATSGGVEFLGAFDNQDAMEIYAGIDVLVVPSIWWENAPMTIHEAILTGTPVIASNFGGMAEFVRHGENGLLFRVGDSEDLARQMDFLLEDPSRIERLRQPVVSIKSIEADAADMERHYLELLGSPAVASQAASR
jgi:glycosyltransferase involved in cell wall biosynthesis